MSEGIIGDPSLLIQLLVTFVPVHQAVVEIFKLTGPKARRYWEALAYIVYGPTLSPKKVPREKSYRRDSFSSFPSTIEQSLQDDKTHTTPQERLIQSFLLRGVGDSPVTDISDSDVRNMIQVIRFTEMQEHDNGHALVSELVDELIRTVPHNPKFIEQRLNQLLKDHPRAKVNKLISKWINELNDILSATSPPAEIKPAILTIWRNELNLTHFQAILRAERELPNVLKAAEFQYVRHLSKFSSLAALIESLLVVAFLFLHVKDLAWYDSLIAFALCFGTLVTVPRGTKSLLDAVIGFGKRVQGN